MKKFLVGTIALMMLCGCGGAKKSTVAVCKGSEEGQDVEMTMTFDGDEKLTEMKMAVSFDAGSEEMAQAASAMMEAQKDTLLAEYEGAADASFEVEGSVVTVTITLDVTKTDNFEDLDFSGTKEEILTAAKADGYTCEESVAE